MAYEVIARKWRPKQFGDVVGQEHVTVTLRNAIKTGRVGQAYLFVGPRGIGKTSIARILAKALNCAEGPTETPCDKCPSCLEVAAGTSLDVVEIDGASTRGIDDIRALRENVKYAPYGRFKIYIIDEVHSLTADAFNALLKTLEEPPPKAKFIFATTEAHKIPLTILSRCQRFDLRRISNAHIAKRISEIAESEGVKADAGALDAIARASEGGLRDAESLLDQLIAFRGGEFSEKDVLSVFGLISRDAIGALSAAILKGDMPAVIRAVEEFDRTGKNMPRLAVELLEHYRNLAVFLHSRNAVAELEIGDTAIAALEEQARLTDIDRVLRIMDTLTDAADRVGRALSKKTFLETALLRCARAATVVSIDELMAMARELAGGEPPARAPTQPQVHSRPQARVERGAETAVAEETTPAPMEPDAASSSPPKTNPTSELHTLEMEWRALADKIGKTAAAVKSYFLDSKPVSVEKDNVVVGFDPEFSERLPIIESPRNREAIQTAVSETLKRRVSVSFVVLNGKESMTLPADHPVAARNSEKKKTLTVSVGKAPSPEEGRQWLKNDAVRTAAEIFKANIVDIRA